GSSDGCTIGGTTTGNLLDTDPLLGPLQDNGGPTFTQAIDTNSPAYNAGNPGAASGTFPCETTDQRGAARPQDGRCDVGAFEAGNADLTPPTTSASTDSQPNAAGWYRSAVVTVTLTAT